MPEKIFVKSIEKVGNDIDAFILKLEDTNKKLNTLLGELINTNKTTEIIDVAIMKQQIDNLLVESGYYEVVDNILNVEYQKLIDMNFENYKKLYGESFQLSELSLQELDALKKQDYTDFNLFTDDISNKLNKNIINLQFGAINRKQAIENIIGYTSELATYSKTWIDTAISGYYTKSGVAMAKDNGIGKFQYLGVDDKLTRPFCKKHLNEIETMEYWSKQDNGQGLPVPVYRGGYNCRHYFQGIVE